MLAGKERESANPLTDLILSLLIVAMLAGLALLSLADRRQEARERQLQTNLEELRSALHRYRLDHGRLPGSPGDFNAGASAEVLLQQLTQYTDAAGRPSRLHSSTFRFGPYLLQMPVEPFSGSNRIWIPDPSSPGDSLSHQASPPTGGWRYDIRRGSIHANIERESKRAYLGLY